MGLKLVAIVIVGMILGCNSVEEDEFSYDVDPNIGESSEYDKDTDSETDSNTNTDTESDTSSDSA